MSNKGEIVRGDDQTISIPTPKVFTNTIGASVALFVVPLTSNPPDTYLDSTALITVQLGPFAIQVDSFDFSISNLASLIPLGNYKWYARYKTADGKLTSITFDPSTVEVIPPKGDDC